MTMRSPLRNERRSPQLDLRRRLRHRDQSVSYVEPKLNVKVRQGDYYGLLKRASTSNKTNQRSPLRSHVKSTGRAEFIITIFGQQRSPFQRRASRHARQISYVEPKLSTKLRQASDCLV
ncbi:unnamed protein product [Globisporangium polare]